jgi:hypothetical protein
VVIGAYSTQLEDQEQSSTVTTAEGGGGRILVYCDSYLIDMKPHTHGGSHDSVSGVGGGVDVERILLEAFLDYLISGILPSKLSLPVPLPLLFVHLESQSFDESRLMQSASSRQRVDEDLLRQERRLRYKDFLRYLPPPPPSFLSSSPHPPACPVISDRPTIGIPSSLRISSQRNLSRCVLISFEEEGREGAPKEGGDRDREREVSDGLIILDDVLKFLSEERAH